jgi:hypothetical protein
MARAEISLGGAESVLGRRRTARSFEQRDDAADQRVLLIVKQVRAMVERRHEPARQARELLELTLKIGGGNHMTTPEKQKSAPRGTHFVSINYGHYARRSRSVNPRWSLAAFNPALR